MCIRDRHTTGRARRRSRTRSAIAGLPAAPAGACGEAGERGSVAAGPIWRSSAPQWAAVESASWVLTPSRIVFHRLEQARRKRHYDYPPAECQAAAMAAGLPSRNSAVLRQSRSGRALIGGRCRPQSLRRLVVVAERHFKDPRAQRHGSASYTRSAARRPPESLDKNLGCRYAGGQWRLGQQADRIRSAGGSGYGNCAPLRQ